MGHVIPRRDARQASGARRAGIFTLPGGESLTCCDVATPLVKGCVATSLHFDTGLRGKNFCAKAWLGDRGTGYRAPGETLPGRGGSGAGPRGKCYRASGEMLPGFGGSDTGLRGKRYRASGEFRTEIYLQIESFRKNGCAPCLKSVKGCVVVVVNNRGGIWQEGRKTGPTWLRPRGTLRITRTSPWEIREAARASCDTRARSGLGTGRSSSRPGR